MPEPARTAWGPRGPESQCCTYVHTRACKCSGATHCIRVMRLCVWCVQAQCIECVFCTCVHVPRAPCSGGPPHRQAAKTRSQTTSYKHLPGPSQGGVHLELSHSTPGASAASPSSSGCLMGTSTPEPGVRSPGAQRLSRNAGNPLRLPCTHLVLTQLQRPIWLWPFLPHLHALSCRPSCDLCPQREAPAVSRAWARCGHSQAQGPQSFQASDT